MKHVNTTIISSIVKIFSALIILMISIDGYSQISGITSREQAVFNKSIPEILDTEIRKALAFYPELKNTRIDFVFRDNINNAVMQAQPRVKTLLRNRFKRTYKIKISRHLTLSDTTISIDEVPEEILVGWIAHELGHVMDYLHRSSAQMVGFGLKYVTSRTFLMEAERQADTYAIQHGLADHIIKTKDYILNQEDLPQEYKERIDDLYLSPEEVRNIEKKLDSI